MDLIFYLKLYISGELLNKREDKQAIIFYKYNFEDIKVGRIAGGARLYSRGARGGN